MALPKVGNNAPAFSLQNQDGKTVSLKDFKGEKYVVVYFYPKAMTPGCTQQACGIRDAKTKLSRQDTVVLGISPDKPEALAKWIEAEALQYDLLSDPDHSVLSAWNAWGERSMYGRTFMGVIRSHWIIDAEGKIEDVQKV